MPASILNAFNQQNELNRQYQMMREYQARAQQLDPYLLGQLGQQRMAAVRSISLEVSPRLFWSLPAVKYLVDRIPAVRVILENNLSPMAALYLQAAKDEGWPLRQQCEALGLPWHARTLTASESTNDTVSAAKVLPALVFAQARPSGEAIKPWARRIVELYGLGVSDAVLHWCAWNMEGLDRDAGDYLRTITTIAPSTKAKTVNERSREWHDRVVRGQRQQAWQLLGNSFGHRANDKAVVPHDIRTVEFHGLSFRALRTYADFVAEGSELSHCVSTRFDYARAGGRCYFSISDKGRQVATAEYANNTGNLLEIKAHRNKSPADKYRAAAEAFSEIVRSGAPASALRVSETVETAQTGNPITWAIASFFGARDAGVPNAPIAIEVDSASWTGRRTED